MERRSVSNSVFPIQLASIVSLIILVFCVGNRFILQKDTVNRTFASSECENILRREAYSQSNPLEASGCSLRRYRTPELVKCLSSLSDSLKNKSYFHIAFSGDSRIRQIYHSFCGMLPLYDAQIRGHIHTRRNVSILHNDAELTSEILRLKVTFLWHPFPNDQMKKDLRKWVEEDNLNAPDVLVTGNMLWSMTELPGHFSDYKYGWSEISRILKELSQRSKVIWLEQDPVNEQRYHDVTKDFTKADVNNRRIQDYNNAVLQSLQDTHVVIWSSSHPIIAEYTRACANNPHRYDSWRSWYCGDATHSGFRHVHLYHQHLLNYVCNPHMEDSHKYCCTDPSTT